MLRLLLPFAIIWIVAAAFWAVLSAPRTWRRMALGLGITVIGLAPLIVPTGFMSVRVVAAFLCFDAIFRLIDANRRRAEYSGRESLLEYLRFFVPFPVLLVTGEEHRQSLRLTTPLARAFLRAALGISLFVLILLVLFALRTNSALRASFVLDHMVKALLFGLVLEVIGVMAPGVERLAGFQTNSPMNRILISRTPAEFWRRYNTRIHAWLTRNVFRPAGGARHPVLGIVLVFLASALLHELSFDVALSRVDGYQFLFFTLQIPAVLASPFLEQLARHSGWPARLVAHALTLAWFGITSLLFFRGMAEVFPFIYAAEPPAPLFGEWRLPVY